jgi:hypothetical protein
MFLRAVKKPLEIIGLEAFTGKRDVERTHKWGARRSVLGVHWRLEHPAGLQDMRIVRVPRAHLISYLIYSVDKI